jgi:hypothetical protein
MMIDACLVALLCDKVKAEQKGEEKRKTTQVLNTNPHIRKLKYFNGN